MQVVMIMLMMVMVVYHLMVNDLINSSIVTVRHSASGARNGTNGGLRRAWRNHTVCNTVAHRRHLGPVPITIITIGPGPVLIIYLGPFSTNSRGHSAIINSILIPICG